MGRQRTSRAAVATAAQAGSAQGAAQEVRRERRTRKTRGKISSRLSTASSKSLLASSVRTGAAFVKSMRAGAAFVTSSIACGEEHRRGKACGRARVPSVRAAHGTQRASARVTARTRIDPDGGRCGTRRRGARRGNLSRNSKLRVMSAEHVNRRGLLSGKKPARGYEHALHLITYSAQWFVERMLTCSAGADRERNEVDVETKRHMDMEAQGVGG